MENMILANMISFHTNNGWYEVPTKYVGLPGVVFQSENPTFNNNYLYVDNMNITLEEFMGQYFKANEVIDYARTKEN